MLSSDINCYYLCLAYHRKVHLFVAFVTLALDIIEHLLVPYAWLFRVSLMRIGLWSRDRKFLVWHFCFVGLEWVNMLYVVHCLSAYSATLQCQLFKGPSLFRFRFSRHLLFSVSQFPAFLWRRKSCSSFAVLCRPPLVIISSSTMNFHLVFQILFVHLVYLFSYVHLVYRCPPTSVTASAIQATIIRFIVMMLWSRSLATGVLFMVTILRMLRRLRQESRLLVLCSLRRST